MCCLTGCEIVKKLAYEMKGHVHHYKLYKRKVRIRRAINEAVNGVYSYLAPFSQKITSQISVKF